jgi:hypothetical protein
LLAAGIHWLVSTSRIIHSARTRPKRVCSWSQWILISPAQCGDSSAQACRFLALSGGTTRARTKGELEPLANYVRKSADEREFRETAVNPFKAFPSPCLESAAVLGCEYQVRHAGSSVYRQQDLDQQTASRVLYCSSESTYGYSSNFVGASHIPTTVPSGLPQGESIMVLFLFDVTARQVAS